MTGLPAIRTSRAIIRAMTSRHSDTYLDIYHVGELYHRSQSEGGTAAKLRVLERQSRARSILVDSVAAQAAPHRCHAIAPPTRRQRRGGPLRGSEGQQEKARVLLGKGRPRVFRARCLARFRVSMAD